MEVDRVKSLCDSEERGKPFAPIMKCFYDVVPFTEKEKHMQRLK